MKFFLLPFILLLSLNAASQNYQPDWQSLDSRPVPQWFRDAKFGIFIHWGVYSVPAWCTKGNYAEWYQYGLETNDTARKQFHKLKFGDRSYYDLANDFKAELFNPDEWAKLFERSGAKYIVLTSKHHDGFTLWPSKVANQSWGFKWNAVDIGPKRDLLGDLFKAVRKTSVHTGMYYSLYEWFNPIWKTDQKKYVAEHAWPQMKDLVNNYQPDVFWTDGEWDATAETWKSKEFLTWLYNESPVKDRVVTYDRWGSGIRFKHGAVYTPEYQPELDFDDHSWEESRGMGFSYGYNREEDAWDYNSTQSLVLQLIDKVSRGGNFLLDIGPDEHGKIPPIMQERLLQIGDWLNINGESIYGTSRWKTSEQWSEGRKDYKEKSGDMLLKITIDPEPGFAVKEVFYTYNESNNSLYAILPKYPDNKKVTLKDLQLPEGTLIHFLSTNESLQWIKEGDNIEIILPAYNSNKIKAPYAYVLKISNFGKFAKKTQIETAYVNNGLQPLVTFTSGEKEAIYYTTDGSDPGLQSKKYSKPFQINETAVVKARSYLDGYLPGNITVEKVIKHEWIKPLKLNGAKQGINYKYYEPAQEINMATAFKTPMIHSGVTDKISLSKKTRTDRFAFEFFGYINIAKDGIYTFTTASDDGSKLFIDDMEVVDNDGEHGAVEKAGQVALKKGYHKIRITYFDSGGGNDLKVMMQAGNDVRTDIPASMLFYK